MKKSNQFRIAWIRNKQKKEGSQFLEKLKQCHQQDRCNWHLLEPEKCVQSEEKIEKLKKDTSTQKREWKDIPPDSFNKHYKKICMLFKRQQSDSIVLSTMSHFPQFQVVISAN
jgi:hypothetical protein